MEVKANPTKSNLEEYALDISVGWQAFKENAKPLIGFGFFTFMGAIILSFIVVIGLLLVLSIFISPMEIVESPNIFNAIIVIDIIVVMVFMFALMGSIFGLAYDILSSGDQFAEFKGAFTYFKRYWWQYSVLSLIGGIVNMGLSFTMQINLGLINMTAENVHFYYVMSILVYIIGWIWYTLFILTMPSITAQGNLKKSLKENWAILKAHPARVLKTSFFYLVIFFIPSMLFTQAYYTYPPYIEAELTRVLLIFMIVFLAINILVANPMMVLSFTRIYNTTISSIREKSAPSNQN